MNDQQSADRVIDHIFENIQEDLLTEWEKGFVKSTKAYWKAKRRLSDKQRTRLKELFEDMTNAKRVYRDEMH